MHKYIYIYIYTYIYIQGAFNKFPDIFMISGSNQQLQQELKYPQLKPDCHS